MEPLPAIRKEQVAAAVKHEMHRQMLTIGMLAERSGVALSTIHRIVTGQNANVESLAKVANGLGVSLMRLCGQAEELPAPEAKETRRDFGSFVRLFRVAKGMTIRDLAKAVNCLPAAIAQLEVGHLPAPGLADRVASALGTTKEEIHYDERAWHRDAVRHATICAATLEQGKHKDQAAFFRAQAEKSADFIAKDELSRIANKSKPWPFPTAK